MQQDRIHAINMKFLDKTVRAKEYRRGLIDKIDYYLEVLDTLKLPEETTMSEHDHHNRTIDNAGKRYGAEKLHHGWGVKDKHTDVILHTYDSEGEADGRAAELNAGQDVKDKKAEADDTTG